VLTALSAIATVLHTVQGSPEHYTIFEDLGQMVTDTSYLHITSVVSLDAYSALFSRMRQALNEDQSSVFASENYKNEQYYKDNTLGSQQLFMRPSTDLAGSIKAGVSIAHQLHSLQFRFNDTLSLLPPELQINQDGLPFLQDPVESESSRQKRVAPIVTAVLNGALRIMSSRFVMGTIFGLFTKTQLQEIETLKDSELVISASPAHQDLLADFDSRLNTSLSILRTLKAEGHIAGRWKIWNTIIDQLEVSLARFQRLVTALQNHRISIDWFTPEQMQELHGRIIEASQKAGLKLLITKLSDYLQLEVSYARMGSELHLYLHVPATMEDALWTIYRYVPFPIPQPDSRVALITTAEDIIAVGPRQHYKVMTSSLFEKCHRKFNQVVCDQPLVASLNMSHSCVGSLMEHNTRSISQHCDVRIVPDREMIFQISNQRFAIHSPVTYTARGECWDKRIISFLIGPSTQVSIPKGCSLVLKHHEIRQPLSVNSIRSPWVMPSEWDTAVVTKDILARYWAEQLEANNLLTTDLRDEQRITYLLSTATNETDRIHSHISQRLDQLDFMAYALYSLCGLLWIVLLLTLCCRYNSRVPVRNHREYPFSPIVRPAAEVEPLHFQQHVP